MADADLKAGCVREALVVTHPFHPLCGQRLDVLRVRRHRAGRLYVCDGGVLGSVVLAEEATDRGPEPCERPLSLADSYDTPQIVKSKPSNN